MRWDDIPGWFCYEELYHAMVQRADATQPSVFIEIGAWMGRSTAYMAQCIRDSGKPIRFYTVDTWLGTPGESVHQEEVERARGSIFPVFYHNMQACGLLDYVRPIPLPSLTASRLFDRFCADFVFIDANHTYEAVHGDITAWYPKVRPGGVMAGDDYGNEGFPGVKQAVDELLSLHPKFLDRWFWAHIRPGRGCLPQKAQQPEDGF